MMRYLAHFLFLLGATSMTTVVAALVIDDPPAWWSGVLLAVVTALIGLAVFAFLDRATPADEAPAFANVATPLTEPIENEAVEPPRESDQSRAFERPMSETSQTSVRPNLLAYAGAGRRGRLPQCPTCGRFRTTHIEDNRTYAFTCTTCGAEWSWSAGQPWPETVPLADVRPHAIPNPRTKE